jgi:agmatinase
MGGPAFCGVRTFLHLPQAGELSEADAAIVGLPLDSGTFYRTGQRFAPEAIRSASALLGGYSTAHRLDVLELLSVIDGGDAAVLPGDIPASLRAIEEHLRTLYAAGVVPIGLGGDHSVTLAELRAAAPKHGPVGLLLFDSHPDTWDECLGQKYTHASPFRRAVEEGLIDPARSTMLGLRGAPDCSEDWDVAYRLGFAVRTAAQLHEQGLGGVAAQALARAGAGPVFLSFDIDFLDPAFAPGTGTPAVGGFTTAQMLYLLRGLAGLNLVAADVVEVIPAYDVAQITAMAAAQVAFEILALLAVRREAAAA